MDSEVFTNVYLLTFVLWPAAVVISALINMLVTWSFSWSELVIDYLIGMVIGATYHFAMAADPGGWENFFLTVSTGLFGALKWAGMFQSWQPGEFFLLCSLAPMGAVLLAAGIDHAHVAIGYGSKGAKAGNIGLSFLTVLIKWPFALITSTVGLIIGIIGLIVRATRTAPPGDGVGFAGGALWFEWGGTSGKHATTFGFVVNVFNGQISDTNLIGHELVHTRQYIYLHDWLGVFYFTVAGLWGLISSAASSAGFDATRYFSADSSKEVGNPLEVAAEHKFS
jgi:hypothetical protein